MVQYLYDFCISLKINMYILLILFLFIKLNIVNRVLFLYFLRILLHGVNFWRLKILKYSRNYFKIKFKLADTYILMFI